MLTTNLKLTLKFYRTNPEIKHSNTALTLSQSEKREIFFIIVSSLQSHSDEVVAN